jgi:NAD(P)-dependent dehydrogenase (short-subunit alcohol dehydrogenase family)
MMNENDPATGEPKGRVASPRRSEKAWSWLLSDAASFVTDHALVIDGGWVAR